MGLTRRTFVKAAGVGGIGVLTAPLIAARGSEALRDGVLYSGAASQGELSFAADERVAYRLAVANAIRLDSNENPNGPGPVALEAIRQMFGEAPRYPDVQTDDLRHTIAQKFKV